MAFFSVLVAGIVTLLSSFLAIVPAYNGIFPLTISGSGRLAPIFRAGPPAPSPVGTPGPWFTPPIWDAVPTVSLSQAQESPQAAETSLPLSSFLGPAERVDSASSSSSSSSTSSSPPPPPLTPPSSPPVMEELPLGDLLWELLCRIGDLVRFLVLAAHQHLSQHPVLPPTKVAVSLRHWGSWEESDSDSSSPEFLSALSIPSPFSSPFFSLPGSPRPSTPSSLPPLPASTSDSPLPSLPPSPPDSPMLEGINSISPSVEILVERVESMFHQIDNSMAVRRLKVACSRLGLLSYQLEYELSHSREDFLALAEQLKHARAEEKARAMELELAHAAGKEAELARATELEHQVAKSRQDANRISDLEYDVADLKAQLEGFGGLERGLEELRRRARGGDPPRGPAASIPRGPRGANWGRRGRGPRGT